MESEKKRRKKGYTCEGHFLQLSILAYLLCCIFHTSVLWVVVVCLLISLIERTDHKLALLQYDHNNNNNFTTKECAFYSSSSIIRFIPYKNLHAAEKKKKKNSNSNKPLNHYCPLFSLSPWALHPSCSGVVQPPKMIQSIDFVPREHPSLTTPIFLFRNLRGFFKKILVVAGMTDQIYSLFLRSITLFGANLAFSWQAKRKNRPISQRGNGKFSLTRTFRMCEFTFLVF